jgi:hypothetical protein
MPNNSEADAAIAALDGSDVGGQPLTVNEARPESRAHRRVSRRAGRR